MKFTDIFIKRPVLALVVSLLLLLIGLRSFALLNVRQFPRVVSTVVSVKTAYPGASPSLIKGFVTTPLESAVSQANGIDYLESSSTQGASQIKVHLQLNYPPYKALSAIISRVQQVRNQLPPESQVPIINVEVGKTTPAMFLSFYSHSLPPNDITAYLNRVVQPQLQAVEGIQNAEILGGRKFAMRIWLNPVKMAAHHVSASEVRSALARNNYLAGVGRTRGQAITVTLNASTDLHTAEQFRDIVIRHEGDAFVRLGDIAKVRLGAESYTSNVKFSGKKATFIGIHLLPTANQLSAIKRVREKLPNIRKELPENIKLRVPYDSSKYIKSSIHEVVQTLGEALLIVIAVIFLFLGSARSMIIPAVAMPLSIIGSGFIMLALGFSINLLTLLAMVLAIGLVVDDAIIVVENIYRHIEQGVAAREAALRGARELASPIIAMTTTLVAVYAPIGFIGGLTGSLFTQFAFTLAGAVLVSGVIALTLSPMLCSKLLKPGMTGKGLARFVDGAFDRFRQVYQRTLHGALSIRPVVLLFGLIVLASCYFLFNSAKQELAPTEDQGALFVLGTTAPNATVDWTTKVSQQVLNVYDTFPEQEASFLVNGSSGTNGFISGFILKPWGERDRGQAEIKTILQRKMNNISGGKIFAFSPPPLPGSGGGAPVQFVIGTTQGMLALNTVQTRFLDRLRKSGKFLFIKSDLKYDKSQVELHIDRDQVHDLGLTMADIGSQLASILGGGYVNYFSIQGKSFKVIPQVLRRFRLNPDQILNYHISTPSGQMVPLSAIMTLQHKTAPETLNRFQQLNSATISAIPLPSLSLGQALNYMQDTFHEIAPKGYHIDYAGQSRQYINEGGALMVTFFLAVLIIFLVLSAQFESFRDPIVILVSVPMSIAGALLFLSAGVATVNIYTQVGLITLIGLISKHGILIVQFANQLQEEGMDKRRAIEEAAGIRLRPVLMTTAAMVLGVMPLITATGAGAESRFDIGLVIATGMAIGTLFTLFVLPAVYMLVAKDHGHSAEPTPASTG